MSNKPNSAKQDASEPRESVAARIRKHFRRPVVADAPAPTQPEGEK